MPPLLAGQDVDTSDLCRDVGKAGRFRAFQAKPYKRGGDSERLREVAAVSLSADYRSLTCDRCRSQYSAGPACLFHDAIDRRRGHCALNMPVTV